MEMDPSQRSEKTISAFDSRICDDGDGESALALQFTSTKLTYLYLKFTTSCCLRLLNAE